MNNKEKAELELSYTYFSKILRFVLVFAIIVVSGFIIYYLLNPEPGHATFGILNENQESRNYPTEATINQEIEFYITVENHFPDEFDFLVKILKGDDDTSLSSTGSSGAIEYKTIGTISLKSEEEWISEKQSVSFSEPGNRIIIVELWKLNDKNEGEFFNILWLRVNVTN